MYHVILSNDEIHSYQQVVVSAVEEDGVRRIWKLDENEQLELLGEFTNSLVAVVIDCICPEPDCEHVISAQESRAAAKQMGQSTQERMQQKLKESKQWQESASDKAQAAAPDDKTPAPTSTSSSS